VTSRESAPPRVVIESVRPQVDGGRFAVKRVLGDELVVEADAFADGHDVVAAELLWRSPSEERWRVTPMQALVNDRWRGSFKLAFLGRYRYTVRAWTDPFLTWRRDLEKRQAAGQDLHVDFLIGADLIKAALKKTVNAETLLRDAGRSQEERYEAAMDPVLAAAMGNAVDPARQLTWQPELEVVVDPLRARYSTWYELFPRSTRADGRHGTFRDCIALLPYVAEMGFDVLYLPPIHPIGETARKGKNNAVTAEPGDVGSPWAIGSAEGGHKAIHPQLGSFDDFHLLVKEAEGHGIQIALDIAFQCSPDHPYVKEHPEWFRKRPDGSIQYAENPPKKYQDIYPFDFETASFSSLWSELKSIFEFWAGHGVRIFRVDNPHTKQLQFWEWAIGELKRAHPDLIFLAEAFTRPRVMHRLAKAGFTQSYTYFAWRHTPYELTEYFTELTQHESREYFRPNAWPNTPDILTDYLQTGGRPAFVVRLVLAATLAASYGLYGPAFELMESAAREPGSEEYLNSEKYEIRKWQRDAPHSLRELIARVNRIRRENLALQHDWRLRFHPVEGDYLLAYSKSAPDGSNVVLVTVNVDPFYRRAGFLHLPLEEWGIAQNETFQVHDLLGGGRFLWSGPRNYIELDPGAPAHIFVLRKRVRSERNFDYF
jgi:starch synthase (maltosyl-transferring)